jgi:hypothetical protein
MWVSHAVDRTLHSAAVIPYIKGISKKFGYVGIDTSRQCLKELPVVSLRTQGTVSAEFVVNVAGSSPPPVAPLGA